MLRGSSRSSSTRSGLLRVVLSCLHYHAIARGKIFDPDLGDRGIRFRHAGPVDSRRRLLHATSCSAALRCRSKGSAGGGKRRLSLGQFPTLPPRSGSIPLQDDNIPHSPPRCLSVENATP